MESTLPTIHDLSVKTNKIIKRTSPSKMPTNKKTSYAAPAFRGNSRREGVFDRRSPTENTKNSTTDCNGTLTEDWLRRHAIATIDQQNAKHEQQKEYPEWTKDADDQCMTTKRPPPESNQSRVYVFDKDYKCDPWDNPELYDQSPFIFRDQPTADTTPPTDYAYNDQSTKEDTNGSNKISIFPDNFPVSRNSIKENISELDGDMYIPLHSKKNNSKSQDESSTYHSNVMK